jgi:hypothetical protein
MGMEVLDCGLDTLPCLARSRDPPNTLRCCTAGHGDAMGFDAQGDANNAQGLSGVVMIYEAA